MVFASGQKFWASDSATLGWRPLASPLADTGITFAHAVQSPGSPASALDRVIDVTAPQGDKVYDASVGIAFAGRYMRSGWYRPLTLAMADKWPPPQFVRRGNDDRSF